jgi:hypothetical protein
MTIRYIERTGYGTWEKEAERRSGKMFSECEKGDGMCVLQMTRGQLDSWTAGVLEVIMAEGIQNCVSFLYMKA